MSLERKTVPCTLCGTKTFMLGTRLCDRCWELKHRVEHDPHLAAKILDGMREPEVYDHYPRGSYRRGLMIWAVILVLLGLAAANVMGWLL